MRDIGVVHGDNGVIGRVQLSDFIGHVGDQLLIAPVGVERHDDVEYEVGMADAPHHPEIVHADVERNVGDQLLHLRF